MVGVFNINGPDEMTVAFQTFLNGYFRLDGFNVRSHAEHVTQVENLIATVRSDCLLTPFFITGHVPSPHLSTEDEQSLRASDILWWTHGTRMHGFEQKSIVIVVISIAGRV